MKKTYQEQITPFADYFKNNKDHIYRDFFTFLSFPSISSEKEFTSSVYSCAKWLQQQLLDIGFTVEEWSTTGHPVIFAQNLQAGPSQPTLLIYNHYDVQPVDPIEQWETPPFEPTIRNGQIYARGAQDNKGQCFYVLTALKAYKELFGSFPINIKWCIEGEEEIGSFGLEHILSERSEQLKADYLAVVDVGIIDNYTPSLTLGCRGIVTLDVTVEGPNGDLHSGSHGGLIVNPILALAQLINNAYREDGSIAIPHIYDDVAVLSDEEKQLLSFDFDADLYEKTFGRKPLGGEIHLPPAERNWLRPTLEVNGMWGGYNGTGFKTVIPAKAHAKVSCRLVQNQDPEKVGHLIADFFEKNAPAGVTVKAIVRPGAGRAIRASASSKVVKAFSEAFSDAFAASCKYIFEGGSIPIVTELAAASKSEVVLVGLGLGDDNIHAPNEHFGVDRIEKGVYIIVRAIYLLSSTLVS